MVQKTIYYMKTQKTQKQDGLANDIFKILLKEGKITRSELLKIFAAHNNYIIGFDDVEISLKLESNIQEAIEVINRSYKISNVNFIWKQKIEENKKSLGSQLNGVSKVISSLAEELEEKIEDDQNTFIKEREEIIKIAKERKIDLQDVSIKQEKTGRYIVTVYINSCKDINEKNICSIEQMEKILTKVLKEKIVIGKSTCGFKEGTNLCINTYTSEDKYILQLGIARKTKDGSPVSGDSYVTLKLDDGKYLLAISDGMGSGTKAKEASSVAIKMLQRLLLGGFSKDTSIELINSTLSIKTEEDTFATLDIAILDLYAGNIEFIKNGACPTYIKERKETRNNKSNIITCRNTRKHKPSSV